MDIHITLKERDLVRLRVIERTLSGLAVRDAAYMLKLSVRQVFRLKARVRAVGAKGIAHGNRGRPPVYGRSRRLVGR